MREQFDKLIGNNKWAMYCIALMVGLAMGVINPLATTHMTRNNVSEVWVGAISSSYFLFMALGSIFIYKKQRGKDIRKILILGLILAAICSIGFPLSENRALWFLLMGLMGAGVSLNLVGIQTAMQNATDSGNKALVSGIYSFCFAVGFVISSLVGPMLYECAAWIAFLMGSVSLCSAAVFINFKLKNLLTIPTYSEGKIFSKITLALFGAFAYGFSETTLVALYPLFMLRLNFGLSQVGYALGIFVIGSIIGTIPVTYLADKFGRKKCLGLTIFFSLFAIIGVMYFNSFGSKLIFSFIAGFTIGPIYPLSLSLSVQDLIQEELMPGVALFTFAYGIGSAAGPFLSSGAMRYLGNNYIFSISFIIFMILILYIAITSKYSKSNLFKRDA
ncbi:putative MFS-type transporter YcaD [Ruminiclostridium hungatei]|uniref:Putative MFS-type transporter YcaD n=1 Tax=Ruminiclostridium hungatei TaxID=48256 RepID=A0A1V4SJD3_RUMHU|nr:MFS transporter [Ruminiclostridium hungatei]OPX43970.1 putative MFS-type transporter YcaD [Ruminiclostridium hungatei]